MKLKYEDIINKHKNRPCVVALHGPSLTPYIEKIQELQVQEDYLRISVNEWYDYFEEKPDYWTVSSSEFTIYNSIAPNWFWDTYNEGWPKDVFNKHNIPLLYNDTADLTDEKFIEENLKCDYFSYDTKHFQKMRCIEILKSFRAHYEKNKTFDFKKFGNNSEMWKPLSLGDTNCHPSWAKFAGHWRTDKCCHKVDGVRQTLQETLQDWCGYRQHAGAGTSVASAALIFAVLMGCNPIYVAGLDMDYSLGYAKALATGFKPRINAGAIGHWKKILRGSIVDDLRILRESAALMGISLINLNKEAWYDTLAFGDLP